MKLILLILITMALTAQELKIKAKSFSSDQKKGIARFNGDVNIIRENDELNASSVIVYTDKDQQPTKFIAEGDVSFFITTQSGAQYKGKAQKTIYLPKTKEYFFYKDVNLMQLGEKKEIIGDEIVLKSIDGKAHAISKSNKPVIMIFDLKEEEKK